MTNMECPIRVGSFRPCCRMKATTSAAIAG
jgi:hypothetical protein